MFVAATIRAAIDHFVAADAFERAVLEHAQELGLQARIEVRHLVEQAASRRPPTRTGRLDARPRR